MSERRAPKKNFGQFYDTKSVTVWRISSYVQNIKTKIRNLKNSTIPGKKVHSIHNLVNSYFYTIFVRHACVETKLQK